MADIAGLERLIEPEVKHLGYDLVRVAMIGGASDPTLQVMAEKPHTRQLDIADCEKISRRLSDMLDLADPIDGSYRLEISSPGIDRPLTRLKDYKDWTGHDARITLREPHHGRKQFTGPLRGLDGELVLIQTKDGEAHALAFSEISTAKLLLTERLIAATAPLSIEGADKIEADSRPADEVGEHLETTEE
ncbi:MAG TPA: ribosome maturation protein RimP [Sphingomicrobium sp.]|nr:ribosome maturation protein RimP [Sphingomicrobium sp.]